ncbi:hypothetical protein [Tenacibaculum sp. Ill]|uniref:hypothetical protein n=1 Tax=Tenacibaculum sp. Ill TaxID=3445935 RepID=UPI003F78D527
MKKFTPYFLALSLSVIFASCSSNEAEVIENNPESLLQSYTLKRDATGAYSIDFNTTENTDVTTVTNVDNSKEIILAETPQKTATKHSNDFSIKNDHLKIGFLEANRGKKRHVYIEDDNITLSRKGTDSTPNYLISYTISVSNDGKYNLDFVVADKVKTMFVYNNTKDTYEVHLSEDIAPLTQANFSSDIEEKNSFSIDLNISQGEKLNLNFVNYYKLQQEVSARTEEVVASYTIEEKPRTSVDI